MWIDDYFVKKIDVNGVEVELAPYTERRHAALKLVQKDVADYLADGKSWEDIPRKQKSVFWMRKAAILWVNASALQQPFFDSDEFEYGKLAASEVFFLSQEVYL
jgi:hypothetical protein